MGKRKGGRKTSACTSFHPDSSLSETKSGVQLRPCVCEGEKCSSIHDTTKPPPINHTPPLLSPSKQNAPLLGALLLGRDPIIPRNIAAQVADEDHGDHPGQEEDDEHGVGDGEPVHLRVCICRHVCE